MVILSARVRYLKKKLATFSVKRNMHLLISTSLSASLSSSLSTSFHFLKGGNAGAPGPNAQCHYYRDPRQATIRRAAVAQC